MFVIPVLRLAPSLRLYSIVTLRSHCASGAIASEHISSMATSRIVTLAKEIEANTTKLDEYLEKNNLPRPSFDVDAPLMYQLPPDIAAAQEALTTALDELYWLNQGPIQTVVAKSVSIRLRPCSRFDRALIPVVWCLGRSRDHPSLQNPHPRSTRLRCNISGACGQDRGSGQEADETVKAWNDGPLLSGIRARLREAHSCVESTPSDPSAGAMVPYGHERSYTRQVACKLSNGHRNRANRLLMLSTDSRCG